MTVAAACPAGFGVFAAGSDTIRVGVIGCGVHGATEAAAFVRTLDVAPSRVAFDAAFDRAHA